MVIFSQRSEKSCGGREKKNLATHNTDLCSVGEKGGGKAHNFKALIELLLQPLRLIVAVVSLDGRGGSGVALHALTQWGF